MALSSATRPPNPTPQVAPRSNSNSSKYNSNPSIHFLETKFHTPRYMQQIHGHLITTGFIKHTPSLTKLLAHSISVDPSNLTYPISIFKHAHQPSIVIWNTILRAFVDHKKPNLALSYYVEMLQESNICPDRFTFPSLLKSCVELVALHEGKALHGQIEKFKLQADLYIQTTLINMYAEFGDLNSMRIVFEKMDEKNQVSWTSVVNGYVKNHNPKQALVLFSEMQKQGLEPDEVSLVGAISACAQIKDLDFGKKLHLRIKKLGVEICVVLGTALVDMYAKCGDLVMARLVFDALRERNVVAWSAMICGFAQNGHNKEVLELFAEMISEGKHEPNQVTILGVLSACTQIGNLSLGRWIHAYINKIQLELSISLQNSLIDMYAKCGRIDASLWIFNSMPEKDIISWNTMINGLAFHGLGDQALSLFSSMTLANEVRPDDITYIGVLSACSHAGLVREGRYHYQSMYEKHGIKPKLEHYGCMVDLFGRAGLLEKAESFIKEMPMEPNGAIWGALLSASKVHNNVELGKKAAKHLLNLEPENDGVYVLLSNILATNKQWEEARKVRDLMRERGIRKTPGCSSIVVNGVAHEFLVGDHSHPESESVYLMLNHVKKRLKAAGYIADTSPVSLNIDEEEKEKAVSLHSEKLAISYGLIKTSPGEDIIIIKNLRICGDCHTAIKFMSKVFKREITVRDRIRFHHFKDGVCSCGDYW